MHKKSLCLNGSSTISETSRKTKSITSWNEDTWKSKCRDINSNPAARTLRLFNNHFAAVLIFQMGMKIRKPSEPYLHVTSRVFLSISSYDIRRFQRKQTSACEIIRRKEKPFHFKLNPQHFESNKVQPFFSLQRKVQRGEKWWFYWRKASFQAFPRMLHTNLTPRVTSRGRPSVLQLHFGAEAFPVVFVSLPVARVLHSASPTAGLAGRTPAINKLSQQPIGGSGHRSASSTRTFM